MGVLWGDIEVLRESYGVTSASHGRLMGGDGGLYGVLWDSMG